MKSYLPAFIVFNLAVAATLFFINPGSGDDVIQLRWMLFAYFSLLTIIFHYGITRATASRPQVFVRYYMASTTIKLMMNLAIIVIYSLFHRELAVNFIITFMIFYFLYTIFEVIFVWKTVKHQKAR